jgi:hypothetical protein
MRIKPSAILSLIFSILLICGAGCTDSGKYAVSAKAGTLGLGGEFTAALAPDINARVGINGLDADLRDKEIEGIDFDLGIDISSYSALLDWYVFDGSFRLSGGIIGMDNKIDLKSRPDQTIKIGDIYFTSGEVGTLHGSIENDEIAPYLGIGWGNPFTAHRRWGFTCDFGVAFTSTPDVTLTATGGTKPPELDEQIAREKDDIKDFFDRFKIYPVIAVSFYYRF